MDKWEIAGSFLIALTLLSLGYVFAFADYAERPLSEIPKQTKIQCPEIPKQANLSSETLQEIGQILTDNCPGSTASCSCDSGRTYEACHLPKSYHERPYKIIEVTGYSNIPSLFAGNSVRTTKVETEKDLIVGCFYLFEHEGEKKLHRLQGIYSDYLVFRGDNNEGIEKVPPEKVERLVTGIRYT